MKNYIIVHNYFYFYKIGQRLYKNKKIQNKKRGDYFFPLTCPSIINLKAFSLIKPSASF